MLLYDKDNSLMFVMRAHSVGRTPAASNHGGAQEASSSVIAPQNTIF